MKIKYITIILIGVAITFAAHGYFNKGCNNGTCGIFSAKEASTETSGSDMPTGVQQATFIELGSKNCIPCRMMQPVMESIEKDYAGKVKVIFYDVWTEEGRPYGQKYGIQAIPTQVFLDKDGNEFYRHIGFLAEDQIVDLLKKQRITKK